MSRSPFNLSFIAGSVLAWVSLSWTGFFPAAVSAEPNYLTRVWQVENGLPQNVITAVVQTRDGYLWVGTPSGLARFDGISFTVFDHKNTPELRNGRVTSLYESADGTLCVGHENGAVTTCKNGKFQAIEGHLTPGEGKNYAITADDAGDLWTMNEPGGMLTRMRDGLRLFPEAGTATKLLSLARSSNGAIWVARDGCLSLLEHGQLRTVYPDWPLTNTIYVQGICASHDGGIWMASNGRLRKWDSGKWSQDLGAAPWAESALTCMVETKTGMLLAGTDRNGFFILFPGTDEKPIHVNYINNVQVNWLLALLEDREGNIWLGTGGDGLVSLRANNIQTIVPPDQWRGHPVLGVCSGHGGELWIGTEGAGLYCLKQGEWTNFGFSNGFGNSYVWSVAENAAGQLFAGNWGAGLFLRDGDHFKFAPGMENQLSPIPALLVAHDDSLWVGTEAGLLHYVNGHTNWFTEVGGKSLPDVRTIAEATNGAIWFGTSVNGLGCLENGRIRQFRQTDGLSSDSINCLHFDADGALWIGTSDNGLCRMKNGKFSVIDREQGLPNSAIGDIEDDGNGFFWMSSHGGIIRVSQTELNNCADGKTPVVRCMNYGVNDGLPTTECSEGLQPAGCRTPDGRLWFPTSKGLVVINPNEFAINHLPPPMVLEGLIVDGQRVTNAAAPLIIPPGHSGLEFHYTALSLVAPEKVQFKYRIEGLEKDWVNAGIKRVANYSYVPPGKYIFHVVACNNDGVWNETGVSLAFTLLPHFWQTWWFKISGGVATLAIGAIVTWYNTRRRMRFKLERIERQHALENERSRIAHDIHDDLGATLTRITMISESEQGNSRNPQEAEADFKQIYDTARELTRAMDEIVWAVNPKHDTLESLVNYLQKFAQDFLNAAGIRCQIDVPSQIPKWPLSAEIRHNLFLAFKEVLNNIVKHAASSRVTISLVLSEKQNFKLSVEDDGRGFAFEPGTNNMRETAGDSSGNGIRNITQRLKKIGGRCEIASAPAKGTKVDFTVALK